MEVWTKKIVAWHAELSFRERLLVGAGVIAVVWMIWLFGVWDVLTNRVANAETSLMHVQGELATARASAQSDQTQAAQRAALSREVEALSDLLQSEREALDVAMGAFVKPNEMDGVLRDVLAASGGVELVALKSLPPKEVSVNELVVFYQHPLVIELEGSFSDIYTYLRAVESRSEVISFDRLEYKVVEHPQAVARVQLSTVSRSKDWLGV